MKIINLRNKDIFLLNFLKIKLQLLFKNIYYYIF